MEFIKDGKVFLKGIRQGNLYLVCVKLRGSVNLAKACTKQLLHQRMGHSSHFPSTDPVCDVCVRSKMTSADFKPTPEAKKPKRILEVVSSDVCGPISPPTHDDFRYYVAFTDHFTRFTHVYLIKTKDEVYDKFLEYEALVKSQFSTRISHFRCDNGGEYSSNRLIEYSKKQGIQLDYTVARNPEQNGVSERLNQSILNMARCLLKQFDVSKDLWGEAVRTAVYTINRLPSSALNSRVPADLWLGRNVSIENMKVFGSMAYTHVPKEDRNSKLADRAKPMIMIGYTANGYRLWDPLKRKVVISRSVRFVETQSYKPTKIEPVIISNEITEPENQPFHDENPQIEALRRSDFEGFWWLHLLLASHLDKPLSILIQHTIVDGFHPPSILIQCGGLKMD